MKKATLIFNLEQILQQAVLAAGYENEATVERNDDFRFGDYKTNVAMLLAKKANLDPSQVARKIIEKLDKNLFEKVEVAGAGFINFYLKDDLVVDWTKNTGKEIFYKNLTQIGNGKTMVIDYSAPNIAKPFGIGHLRSTNIGQAIYNLYKILGWRTIGDNHIGDWGTQFGKLIYAILNFSNKPIEQLSIAELEKLYVEFHFRAETDEKLVEEGRAWFAKLEAGDEQAKKIWQTVVDLSLKEYDEVYNLLGVKIDYVHGESFYQNLMDEVIAVCKEKKLTTESQGALIMEFPDLPPAMLVKSNGTTTYFTRDLATILFRQNTWKPDLAVYEVGADQSLHFRQLFAAARLLSWWPTYGMVHVAHGLIRWQGGKFSTRKGDTIHLADVIGKAIEEANKLSQKAHVQKESGDEDMVKNVAVGAIKFADLSSDPRKDIIFDWDRVMSLEGDSGPYLQYTYARCISLLSKVENQDTLDNFIISTTVEKKLWHLLIAVEEKIIESADRFSPSVICTYAIQVARLFNEFYGTTPILNQIETPQRILLTNQTKIVLKLCLDLLGIAAIDRI